MRVRPSPRRDHCLINIEDAAGRLGVSRRTLWSWIQSGVVPVIRLSTKTIRIDSEDLSQFIDQCRERRGN